MSEIWNQGWVLERAARGKWCPFARVQTFRGDASINRHETGTIARGTECLTTGCMSWEAKPASGAERPPAGRCLLNYRGD